MSPNNDRESPKMSTVEFFCQDALRTTIAPRSIGSVKERIRVAARTLGWSYSRTKDAWYSAPKMSIKPSELFRIEAVSGLEYARQEVRTNDAAIERATALIGANPHLARSFFAAMLKMVGIQDRA